MIRTGKKLLVCGSINMDLVVRVDTLPTPRETVAGKSLAEVSGGKGANQAVAACRLGAEVAMLGMVGTDSFGNKLRSCLRQEGVQVDLVGTKEGPSGIAIIPVDKKGENMIIVVPGANGQLSPEDVDAAVAAIEDAGLVMLQLEIPVSTVLHVIRICKKRGIPVILNTAPVPEEFPGELLGVDLVCPNQKEAAAILGIPTPETIEEVNHAAHRLIERGAKQAVLTMGGKGAVLACKMQIGRAHV